MSTDPVLLGDLPAGRLEGVHRIETTTPDEGRPLIAELVHAVYPHDEVFGDYCTVRDYIDAPPDEVFAYLADTRSLAEWTYSLRGFERVEEPASAAPELWVSWDKMGDNTKIYTRTESHPGARTVDYHCAWDQSEHLWMIYLIRVVDAQLVFNKPGSVVLWTNCRHPFYDDNPFPETAPPDRPVWVGDLWDMFGPGHYLELQNLKRICEYRHVNGLPLTPAWMTADPGNSTPADLTATGK